MKNMKKLLALALCVVLAMGLIACSEKEPDETEPVPTTTVNIADSAVAGKLIYSTNASVISISYEATGLVTAIEGINAEGDFLIEEYSDYLGKTCEDVVAQLVTLSIESSSLTPITVIKPVIGSNFPNADFLNNIVSKAQLTADTAYATTNTILIPLEKLDDAGYINLETAKSVVLSMLGLEKATTFVGDTAPDAQGQYLFYVEEGDVKGHYLLDATLCTIEEVPDDDPRLWGDSENFENFDEDLPSAHVPDNIETPNVTSPSTAE